MNLYNKYLEFLLYLAIGFLTILSLIFDKFLQLVSFVVLAFVMSLIFVLFQNIILNRFQNIWRLYLSVLIVMLSAISVAFYVLSQNYSLISIGTYIFPLLTVMIIAALSTRNWRSVPLLRECYFWVRGSKYKDALDLSNKIVELYPGNYYSIYTKAYILGLFGKYQEQVELLDKNTSKKLNKDQKALILNLKVFSLLKLKRYEEAEEIIDNILKKCPKHETTFSNKADLLSKLGYEKESSDYNNDSLKIIDKKLLKYKKSVIKRITLPDNIWNIGLAELWSDKGNAHQRLHQYDESLECFNNALEISPENSILWNSKGYVLAKLKQYDEALSCVNKALELNIDNDYLNSYSLDTKGYILAELGKPEEALKYLQKAIEIDPQDEEKYYNKGKIYQRLQQYNKASECFNKALNLNHHFKPAKEARQKLLNYF